MVTYALVPNEAELNQWLPPLSSLVFPLRPQWCCRGDGKSMDASCLI
jgi:hypothetical protein